MTGISDWYSMWVSLSAFPNITAFSDTPVLRSLLSSNPSLHPPGWSAASTQMLHLSRLISSLWVWNQRSGNRSSTVAANPPTELPFDAERPVLQPLVQVQGHKPVNLRNRDGIIASFENEKIAHTNELSDASRTPVNITVNTTNWTPTQAAQVDFVDLQLPLSISSRCIDRLVI